MRKVTRINKTVLREMRTELEAVLSKFEKKGIKFDIGNMRYTEKSFTVKLEALVDGAASKIESALEAYTKFKVGDIIRIAQLGEVKLTGYKTKNRKYPYIVETVHTGHSYKLSQAHIDTRVDIV